MADLSIQNAFLDGINEVFSIMFTNEINFYYMDLEATVVDTLYSETVNKVYKEPVKITGKIIDDYSQGEEFIETIQVTSTITIPTKQFIINNIPYESFEDLELMRKGKFEYKGIIYLIDEITPKTLVADKWQIYEFKCKKDKNVILK